jgi:Cell wall hydrolyses involved in spore germination
MAVIKTNAEHTRMLARLMRAEAEGEGDLGMLMVGNVGVNRVRGNCLDFKNIRSIPDMVYQSPGGFEAIQKVTFTKKPGKAKFVSPGGSSAANASIRLPMRCGFSGRPAHAPAPGGIRRTAEDSRPTVSTFRRQAIVRPSIK